MLMALMAGVFFLVLWAEARAIPSYGSKSELFALTEEQTRPITGVVTTIHMSGRKPGMAQAQTLVGGLPSITRIYLVRVVNSSDDNSGDHEVQLFREWLSQTHPGVEAIVLDTQLNRYMPDEDKIITLTEDLRVPRRHGNVVVDVTADTKPCTIVMTEAAKRAGLPVTYMATVHGDEPGQVFRPISVYDPDGIFSAEHSQASTETP